MAGSNGYNAECLEVMDIVPAIKPIDLQTGANNGTWVNMAVSYRCLVVLFKAAGTAGDDPIFTINQATDNAGTGSKALTFTRIRTKLGASTIPTTWTIATQAAAGTYTPTSAANPALIAVDIKETDLDINNGFNHIQLVIPDTGTNAQLGCAFYIPFGLDQPQSIPASSLS